MSVLRQITGQIKKMYNVLLISSWLTCGDVQHTMHQKFLSDYKMKEFKDNNNLRVVSVNKQQSLNFLDSCRACSFV